MKHIDLINKSLGKPIDYDHAFGVQCVDWARYYCDKMGYPIGPFGGSAWNGWKTGCPFDDSWVIFEYRPGMYPKQGDIVFWSEARCLNGHVAVANKFCNDTILRCTDANGTGKGDPVTARFYSYKNVVGWYSKLTGK